MAAVVIGEDFPDLESPFSRALNRCHGDYNLKSNAFSFSTCAALCLKKEPSTNEDINKGLSENHFTIEHPSPLV